MDPMLQGIWARRRPEVVARVALVEAAAAALAAGTSEPAAVEAGRAAAHKLAGSLGMFGAPDGSAVASRLEDELRPGADPTRIAELARALRASVPPAP